MDDFVIDTARMVVDKNGFIFDKAVLEQLQPGDIVRISYFFTHWECSDDKYSADSPYVKILRLDATQILGQVLGINHTERDVLYPIREGERIWFSRSNIFEINTEELSDAERAKKIEEFLLPDGSHVPVTGTSMLLDDNDYSSSSSSKGT